MSSSSSSSSLITCFLRGLGAALGAAALGAAGLEVAAFAALGAAVGLGWAAAGAGGGSEGAAAGMELAAAVLDMTFMCSGDGPTLLFLPLGAMAGEGASSSYTSSSSSEGPSSDDTSSSDSSSDSSSELTTFFPRGFLLAAFPAPESPDVVGLALGFAAAGAAAAAPKGGLPRLAALGAARAFVLACRAAGAGEQTSSRSMASAGAAGAGAGGGAAAPPAPLLPEAAGLTASFWKRPASLAARDRGSALTVSWLRVEAAGFAAAGAAA
mmetsp:Transcript_15655/g.33939  ORF Transcript_15655/g.33939 Transcript_15655/m.33939 type:complete len:268 (+) Transcript_15655:817-1620(+)